MKGRIKSLPAKIAVRLLLWGLVITVCVGFVSYHYTLNGITKQYAENFHMRMLINYEYTRRVLSDVYVQVSNHVYYIEQSLDKPETQVDAMMRIVRNGNRVHSCGMNFIKNYYPEKGEKYCPFAWRNPKNRDEILADLKGDQDFDYLNDRWFRSVIEGDTCEWSDPFYDGYDKSTTLVAYMVPIHDAEGKPVAVLGADISLEWLTGKLDETDSTYNAQNNFADKVMGLKSQSFIINYDGKFITHPKAEKLLEGQFFHHVRGSKSGKKTLLERKMKAGEQSSDETQERYLFNGEESYFFYTPLKYTDWTMVTVVPCRQIDMLGLMYVLKLMAYVLVGMFVLVAVAYVYMKKDFKNRYETDKLECERPEGV
ncbi:MAG: hypothetical protein J6M36_04675 [Prevotella sp.]|nr:hypothetical protein [Prevotella sp.]